MTPATHGNEDGRHGKVLRSSRRKSGKKLLELTGADQLCLRIFDSPGVRLFLNVRIIGKRRINGKTFSVNIAGHLQVCNEKHMNNKQTVNPKMFVFLLEIEKMWVIVYFFLSLLQIPTY